MAWPTDDYRTMQQTRPGLVIGTALAVSVAVVTGLWLTVDPGPLAAHSKRTVPPLVGMSLAEARRAATERGLIVVVTGTVTDPIVVRGGVASQQPLAGAAMHRGQTVEVVLSDGPDGAAPSVSSEPLDDAAAAAPRTAPKPTRPAHPPPTTPPETTAPRGTTAPKTPSLQVPRVLGLSLQRAKTRLRRARLRPGQLSEAVDEDRRDRTILRQSPAAGTRVVPGTAVDLTVNNTSNL